MPKAIPEFIELINNRAREAGKNPKVTLLDVLDAWPFQSINMKAAVKREKRRIREKFQKTLGFDETWCSLVNKKVECGSTEN